MVGGFATHTTSSVGAVLERLRIHRQRLYRFFFLFSPSLLQNRRRKPGRCRGAPEPSNKSKPLWDSHGSGTGSMGGQPFWKKLGPTVSSSGNTSSSNAPYVGPFHFWFAGFRANSGPPRPHLGDIGRASVGRRPVSTACAPCRPSSVRNLLDRGRWHRNAARFWEAPACI